MKRVWLLLVMIVAACGVVAAVATLTHLRGAAIPILEPAGPIAFAERHVILFTFALCAIIVVPTFVVLFTFAWRYRAEGPLAHVHHRPDWDHDNKLAEASWWLPPIIIIAVLGVLMWQSSHQLDPYKPLPGNNPLTVDVVALDWKWLFIYPAQNVASVNLLELPEGVPVHFALTADAPMNSFWIPALGGQIMVMPGMTTQLNLEASKTGSFSGFSGNISGTGFSGMAFTAKAVSQGDFDAWAAAAEASSTPLDAASYTALAAPSEYNPVVTYAPIDLNLFESTIMKYMMPSGQSMNSTSMGSMTMP